MKDTETIREEKRLTELAEKIYIALLSKNIHKAYKLARGFINFNPLKRKESDWISVKDKLPDDLCYHLVAWKVEEITGTTVAMYEVYKNKKWYRHHGNFPIQLNGITHWMPFPEPPTKKSTKHFSCMNITQCDEQCLMCEDMDRPKLINSC